MGSEHLRGGELGGYPVVAHRALPVGFEVAFGQEGLAHVEGGELAVHELVSGAERARSSTGGRVRVIALAERSPTVAHGTEEGQIVVVDVATGRTLRTLVAPGAARALRLSPSGSHVLAAGGDYLLVSEVHAGEPTVTALPRRLSVEAWALSPDGRWAAAASRTGARLWDTRTGKARVLATRKKWTQRVLFSPDGLSLAVGSSEGGGWVWVFDVPAKEPLLELEVGNALESNLGFSPDGALLSAGSYTDGVSVWKRSSGERRALGQHADRVVFAPDGRRLFLASRWQLGGVELETGEATLTHRPEPSVPILLWPSADGLLSVVGIAPQSLLVVQVTERPRATPPPPG
jgi:dipeptidyl aminopeptidase/acylaminoacyl peptidase